MSSSIHEFAAIIPGLTPEEHNELNADVGGARDDLDLIVSLVNRRQLNESQRALIAAEIAMLKAQHSGSRRAAKTTEARERTTTTIARLLNVSPALVRSAKELKQKGSKELIEQVRSGTKNVSDALKAIQKTRAKAVVGTPPPSPNPQGAERIAIEHGLRPDFFKATKVAKRVGIWIHEEARELFRRAAGFQKMSMQEQIIELIAEHIAPAPESTFKRVNSLNPVDKLTEVGLTREQVDPDFVGSDLEFVRQYGQVNLQTKAQIDASRAVERAEALSIALRDFTGRMPASVTVDDVRTWIEEGQKSGGRRDERIRERAQAFRSALERIMPVLEEIEKRTDA
jgi:hypothetical protein